MKVNIDDINDLKELLRCADPWDKLRDNLLCGKDARDMIHSTRKIIKYLKIHIKTVQTIDK